MAAGTESPPTWPPQAPLVMIVGDSFTVGSGPVRGWDGYAARVARELGWQLITAGAAGTGFVNPGRVGRTFRDSFVKELSWRPEPDMLIISGGRNDRGIEAVRIENAAVHLLALVRRRWPHTRIVLVGPIWMTRAPRWAYGVREAVSLAADRQEVPFLDPFEPLGPHGRGWGRGAVLPDGVHPTLVGHLRLSRWMVSTLHRYGIDARSS
ncbi:SGNH/GDSL hydrolase family protein [Streptosporangium sp. NBC_01495]|uniref:SGNH/GDSL hydrolase family protein n=1 Tax=Streptosporangium sp. NBC_01495 TaxID=2903899 RepID=UPI002E369E92|nr:SGNH/GDSL hydrolase family protein [Streptosporangium sp. NBC_01495]